MCLEYEELGIDLLTELSNEAEDHVPFLVKGLVDDSDSVLVDSKALGVSSNNRGGPASGLFSDLRKLCEDEQNGDSGSGAGDSEVYVLSSVSMQKKMSDDGLQTCTLVRLSELPPEKNAFDAMSGPMKEATPFQDWQNWRRALAVAGCPITTA